MRDLKDESLCVSTAEEKNPELRELEHTITTDSVARRQIRNDPGRDNAKGTGADQDSRKEAHR